jgi:glycine/D-amino acid oxidase-like deaminating enzyme
VSFSVPHPRVPRRLGSFVDTSQFRSYWLEQAGQVADPPTPVLSGTTDAAICIVGGGFTGMWTAYQTKRLEPDRDVVLLEASTCGSGASGRNGGFVMSWWSKFGSLAAKAGVESALWLAQESADAITQIGAFCDTEGISDWFSRRGWAWIATNAAQAAAWSSTVAQLGKAGVRPFAPLDGTAAAELTGSRIAKEGVFEESCGTVQPAILAFALRGALIRSGVRVYEHSPIERIEHGHTTRLQTAHGEVRADRVVLALGSWTAAHIQAARRGLIVVGSDIVLTEPIGDLLDEIGVPTGLAISDSRLMVNYFHRTRDDRMALGVGGSSLAFASRVNAKFHGETSRVLSVQRNLTRLYPQLGQVRLAANWTGPVDRSISGLPFIHRQGSDGRVLVCAGFSGNGVGPSFVSGRILASLSLGHDDAYARCALVGQPERGYPPEPVRWVGGQLVRRAVGRKEAADERGVSVGWSTRWLANRAPAGLVPTERA